MVQVFACKTRNEQQAGHTDQFIRYIATRHGGLSPDQLILQRSDLDKPYIGSAEHFHFNVSHSGQWVVCAIHDRPVGIDVERIVDVDISLYREHLSAPEYYLLKGARPHMQLELFYELWTLKESYMKQTGLGVQLHPGSFTIQKVKDEYAVLNPDGTARKDLFFRGYDIDSEYKISVCATENVWKEVILVNENDVWRM